MRAASSLRKKAISAGAPVAHHLRAMKFRFLETGLPGSVIRRFSRGRKNAPDGADAANGAAGGPATPVFQALASRGYKPAVIERLNLRYRHVAEPFLQELAGATLLDLGSNDGRWPYAFITSAGVDRVTAIEGRGEVLEKFQRYAEPDVLERVEQRVGDFFEVMGDLLAEGRRYDVVACLGVFYHTVRHLEMLELMTRFEPGLIILDSIFSNDPGPAITIAQERTARPFNIIGDRPTLPIGRMSVPAFHLFVESLGFRAKEVKWQVPWGRRRPVGDYFGQYPDRTRRTFALRPH